MTPIWCALNHNYDMDMNVKKLNRQAIKFMQNEGFETIYSKAKEQSNIINLAVAQLTYRGQG